jgi:hypothetical protein
MGDDQKKSSGDLVVFLKDDQDVNKILVLGGKKKEKK